MRSLVASVVLPFALLTALLAVGAALMAGSGAKRGADKELDARAATVK
jgi:hypothetical protein